MEIKVYYMSDPRSIVAIRYIGITTRTISERLKEHLREGEKAGKKTYKIKWLDKLKRDGVIPHIAILESIDVYDIDEAFQLEIQYIKLYKEYGYKLVNTTNGGGGCVGYIYTQEEKDNQSKRFKKLWATKTIEERREWNKHLIKELPGNTYRKGKKDPPERLISKSLEKTGKKHPRWKGYLVQMDLNQNEIKRWESITQAAKELQVNYKHLWQAATRKCIKKGMEGKSHSYHGHMYKYDKNEKI